MSTPTSDSHPPVETRRHGLPPGVRAWVPSIGVAVGSMLLVWAVHRLSPRTLISFHGMLHAGILEVLLRPDGMNALPPENPFFAGEPLPYYWFYHVLAAGLVRFLRMNTFHALEFFAILAAGGLVVVAAALGRQLYRSTLAGLLLAYLVIAGTNPLGVLFAAARVVRNGPGVLRDDPHHLWGVVHPLYSLIRYGDVGGLYGPLLNFYLNITSRPAALTALLLAALCLYRGIRDRRASSWLLFGLAYALTTLFSPIIGITAGAAIGAGFLVVWLRSRPWSRRAPAGFTITVLLAAGLAVAGGVLLAAPTYYHLLAGPSSSSPRFLLVSAAGLKLLIAVVMSVLPLLLMAVYGARRAPHETRQYLQVLLVAAVVLLALTVGITLPDGNSSNMFHAAAVLLAVPAAAAVLCPGAAPASIRCSARRAALIVAVFLPTTLALLASYLGRPSVAAGFDRVHLERTPADSERAGLYRWVRGATDPTAVFVIDPRNSVTLGGNIGEFPAMTGRSVFTEELDHYMVGVYPDADVRVELAVKLVSGLPPDRQDLAYLAGLRRACYLLSDAPPDSQLAGQLQALYGRAAFQQGRLAAYRLPVPVEPPTK